MPVGDPMPTDVVLADGGRLVCWFSGDAAGARLHAGTVSGSGPPTTLRVLGTYLRPPCWSAHPQLRIAWIAGVPPQERGNATDPARAVIASTQSR